MRPREQILDLFSTFGQVEVDHFCQWISDPKLRRSMQRCLLEQGATDSEKVWSLYWYKNWQNQNQGLAALHLTAYLQEPCYWVAQKIWRQFNKTEYTLADYLQIASAEVPRVLKGFNVDRGNNLKSFATLLLTNVLKDNLRQRQSADICSEWALLRKVSKKRVVEAMQQVGLTPPEIEELRFAWVCFGTLYVPNQPVLNQTSGGERSAQPGAQLWVAITELYNNKRHGQAIGGLDWTADQMTTRLAKLARWIRAYLYPAIDSLNQAKSGQDTSELQDDLTDPTALSLLDVAIQQEETDQRLIQRSHLQTVLQQALEQLDASSQELLILFYQQGLSQQALAAHFRTSQPTVSRRLKKAEECLLSALIQWSQEQLNKFSTPDELTDITLMLKEWLIVQYANTPAHPRP